jgi:hypothetical protein
MTRGGPPSATKERSETVELPFRLFCFDLLAFKRALLDLDHHYTCHSSFI